MEQIELEIPRRGGLVDLQKYGGVTAASPMLARVVAFAARTFERPKLPLADPAT